jgi:hypothetical protein
MKITSWKEKYAGLKMPFRATSIIPLENVAPRSIPTLATINMVRKEATRDPMAELRKFTASLLTPTIKSTIAVRNKMIMRMVKKDIEV